MKIFKNKSFNKETTANNDFYLPQGWTFKSLKEICDVRDGTHDSPKFYQQGIPFVTTKNLINGDIDFSSAKFISEKDHEKFSQRSFVETGDILTGMIGTIGNPVRVKHKTNSFSIKNVGLIKPKNLANHDYVFFAFDKEIQKTTNIIGSVMKFMSLSELRNTEIMLPPEKEQINIALILDKQLNIINYLKSTLNNNLMIINNYQNILLSGKTRIKLSVEKEKELLSKGVISLVEEKTEKEQFSFFNINDGKFEEFVSLVDLTKDIIFYQNDESNWETEEVNELQKQIPKDWNVEQLYKKVNFIKGKSISENQLNYNGEGIKYLKTTEFWLDSSSKRDTVHYNGKVEEKYLKKKDEYVLGMDGFNSKIGEGTLGLISNEDEGIVSTHFFKLEKNDIYHLVVNVLKSNYVQNFIVRLGEGTTVRMAGKYLKNLQGIFPKSTVEQKLLSMIFEKEEKLVDSLKEKIKLEEKVFKYLQQELLSGRIRIKVEE